MVCTMEASAFPLRSYVIRPMEDSSALSDTTVLSGQSGLVERRGPYVEAAPIHLLCSGLAAVIVWMLSSLLFYITSEYEVQYVKRQVMGVRLCGLVLVISLVVFVVFPHKTQSLFSSIIGGLATLFAVAWGMFVDEHVVIRWLHMLSTVGILIMDTYSVGLQADLLDCQRENKCLTGDPQWVLMLSYVRQYIAVTFELLAILYALYPIQTLGCFINMLLPEDYGIPRHMRELAKATITRKKLEARDPKLFDKGNVHELFDPTEPLEIKWDAFTDTLLGDKRKSWPISKNRRRLSIVSTSELQRRLRILAKLNLPIDAYLEMRKEMEGDGQGSDEFVSSPVQGSFVDDEPDYGIKKLN